VVACSCGLGVVVALCEAVWTPGSGMVFEAMVVAHLLTQGLGGPKDCGTGPVNCARQWQQQYGGYHCWGALPVCWECFLLPATVALLLSYMSG